MLTEKEFNKLFATNLVRYLEMNNMKQLDLAKRMNVSTSTINSWVHAQRTPRMDKVDAMCEIFDCTRSDLIATDSERGYDDPDSVVIPVYGRVAAGTPIEANQDNIVGEEKIPRNLARRGDFYALVIKGDSMEPMLFDGDTVIVREQPDAEHGELVVATINGDDATCKKLYKLPGGGIQLHSLNPAYEPFTFSEDDVESIPVRVLGKVVEMRRRF